MTEHRPLAGSEDGGEPRTAATQPSMPDRVHAAVDRKQALPLDAVVNGIEGEAERDELSARDDAVLLRRERRDRGIPRMRLR